MGDRAKQKGRRLLSFLILFSLMMPELVLPGIVLPGKRAQAEEMNYITPTEAKGEIWNGNYLLTSYEFCENTFTMRNSYHYVEGPVLTYHTVDTIWSKNSTKENGRKFGYPMLSGTEGKDWKRTGVSARDKGGENGVSSSEYVYEQAKLKSILTSLFGKLQPDHDYTVYVSEIFVLQQRHADGTVTNDFSREYRNIDDIRGAAGWTETTRQQFEAYYDIPMTFRLCSGTLHILCVDSENPYINYSEEVTERLVYGDVKNIVPKGEIAGNEGEIYVYNAKYGISYNDFPVLDQSGEPGNVMLDAQDVYLYLGYQKKEIPPPTATPKPTVTPKPGAPDPTSAPTPIPTAAPTPTPRPLELDIPITGEVFHCYNRYFTTTEGYTIDRILEQDSSIPASRGYYAAYCNSNTTAAYCALGRYDILKKTETYSLGTDAAGNRWGCIVDRSRKEAREVHPVFYNGLDLSWGDNIAKIDRLVFPERITIYGETYTVKSIGGSGYRYRKKENQDVSRTSTSADYLSFQSLEHYSHLNSISGVYMVNHITDVATMGNTAYGSQIVRNANRGIMTRASYWYGVMGNGCIETYGELTYAENNYVTYTYNFSGDLRYYNYYVYNTTLKEVFIPDSVTEIMDYAFCYCQALEKVEGGRKLNKIGNYAFMGVETVAAAVGEDNDVTSSSYRTGYRLYYPYMNTQKSYTTTVGGKTSSIENFYNESKSMDDTDTEIMAVWKQQIQLGAKWEFPAPEQVPELSVLGYRAFAFHGNLKHVVLSEQVSSVGKECFGYDRLTEVYVKNDAAQIGNHYQTLGTNGFLTEEEDPRTNIYAKEVSTAADYTEQYGSWYQMDGKKEIRLEGWGADVHTDNFVEVQKGKMSRDVTPPIKYDYIFKGYFTEPEGKGTQYYDEEGKCIHTWEEKAEAKELYASWGPEQTAWIEPYEPKEVEPLEETVHMRIKKDESEVLIYADSQGTNAGMPAARPPYHVDDVYAGTVKTADGGIPSTKRVAACGRTGAWLYDITMEKQIGTMDSIVRVTVPYDILYQGAGGAKEHKTGSYTIEVAVPKWYSYWEVTEAMPYLPAGVTVNNAAFTGSSVFIPADLESVLAQEILLPEVTVSHRADAPEPVCMDYWEMYTEVYENEAAIDWERIRVQCENLATRCSMYAKEPVVQNDRLVIGGITLLENEEQEKNGGSPDKSAAKQVAGGIPDTEETLFCKTGIALDAYAQNADYASAAQFTYVSLDGAKTMRMDPEETKVNKIKIHTPVICSLLLEADYETKHQEQVLPKGAAVLVLDAQGNDTDFVLLVDNTGFHSNKTGYGEGDYAEFAAQREGDRQNEVCFPFDVWVDIENDGKKENDIVLEKNTWYQTGTKKQRFWLPKETPAGEYTVLARTVAVNGAGREDYREYQRNGNRGNYCAYDETAVYITGKLYDFCVTKVTGNGVWKGNEAKTLTVGIDENQSPKKNLWDTLPLRNGVHPVMKSGGELLPGDTFDFTVKSIGFAGENCVLKLIPQFFYSNGTDRERVQIYYDQVTSKGVNLKRMEEEEYTIVLSGTSEQAIRTWSGSFRLPDTCYAADTGVDVMEYMKKNGLSFQEEFWKKDGALLLCLELQLETESGRTLYYGSVSGKVKNNTWRTEAGTAIRSDKAGNEYRIEGGEVAVIDSDSMEEKDFSIYGVY